MLGDERATGANFIRLGSSRDCGCRSILIAGGREAWRNDVRHGMVQKRNGAVLKAANII